MYSNITTISNDFSASLCWSLPCWCDYFPCYEYRVKLIIFTTWNKNLFFCMCPNALFFYWDIMYHDQCYFMTILFFISYLCVLNYLRSECSSINLRKRASKFCQKWVLFNMGAWFGFPWINFYFLSQLWHSLKILVYIILKN